MIPKNKILLSLFVLLMLPMAASAVAFPNFSVGGVIGSINTANGFYDDDGANYVYTDQRNVYVVTEPNEIWMFEPGSYASGVGRAYKRVQATGGLLHDAVVHNGYLYFINDTTLLKKKTRNDGLVCNANDTGTTGCAQVIATSIGGEVLRVYNGVLYYFSSPTAIAYLDSNDNPVSWLTVGVTTGTRRGLAVATVGGRTSAFYERKGGAFNAYLLELRNTTGAVTVLSSADVAMTQYYPTLVTLDSYVYSYYLTTGTIVTNETLVYLSNLSMGPAVDYITTDYNHASRLYVGSKSTIGLWAGAMYQTFNSIEAGNGESPPTSEGSGIVQYVDKTISVPNPTYFNDSIIPFNINLKFIISAENHTNYQNSMFWHVKVDDPRGLQVYDLNLPAIACVQSHAWWDVLGLFTSGDFSCDGSGTVDYTPAPGQFWLNGTWTVSLTEEIPGTISLLSTDTWVITNESSNNTGVINPPPPCPTCGLGTGGTINTNTSLQIIQVFSFVAFWGFIIWLGIVGTIIGIMAKSPSGVNGMAVIVVAWLSAVFIALIGLFDPFKIYIIVLSTIIAAVLFRFGKNATTTED